MSNLVFLSQSVRTYRRISARNNFAFRVTRSCDISYISAEFCENRASKKKKNFIKPQYNSSLNTQHCGRLPEKTNVHHAGHLNKNTHRKKRTYEHKTTKKERKDSEITQYVCDTGVSNTMSSYQDTISEFVCLFVCLLGV